MSFLKNLSDYLTKYSLLNIAGKTCCCSFCIQLFKLLKSKKDYNNLKFRFYVERRDPESYELLPPYFIDEIQQSDRSFFEAIVYEKVTFHHTAVILSFKGQKYFIHNGGVRVFCNKESRFIYRDIEASDSLINFLDKHKYAFFINESAEEIIQTILEEIWTKSVEK